MNFLIVCDNVIIGIHKRRYTSIELKTLRCLGRIPKPKTGQSAIEERERQMKEDFDLETQTECLSNFSFLPLLLLKSV